jgi:hypothetical protein
MLNFVDSIGAGWDVANHFARFCSDFADMVFKQYCITLILNMVDGYDCYLHLGCVSGVVKDNRGGGVFIGHVDSKVSHTYSI